MLPLQPSHVEMLTAGEAIGVLVPRGTVTEGDEIELGRFIAIVTAVDPTALVDATAPGGRHVLATTQDGDLVILRVYDGERPVLGDDDFNDRVRSIEGAMR